MDKVCVQGLEVYGYHGFLPEERVLGQSLIVDLEVGCDLRPVGESDALGSGISYVELIAIAQEIVSTTKFQLLEAVAEAIAAKVLSLAAARNVHIRIEKPRPPIPNFKGTVSIAITREKG